MRARELLTILILSLAVAVLWTWPLAADMDGRLPHDPRFAPFAGSDMNIWVWNFWWVREAIESGSPPFFCDRIFPPFGHSLALHTHTFLWGLISLPLQWIGGVFFAVNAMLLLLFASASTATYALARTAGLRPLPAGLAAFAWGFSPYFLQKGLVHLNLFASPWMPLGLLFLLRWMNRRPGERAWVPGLGVGLVLGMSVLTGSLQAVYLTMALATLILVRPRRKAEDAPSRWRLFEPIPLIVAGIALILSAQPFLSEWWREWKSSGGYGSFPQEYHPHLVDFFRPSGLHPAFTGIGAAGAISDAPFSGLRSEHAGLSLRFSLLALGLIGIVRSSAARSWALGFGFLFLLSWDPGPEPEGFLSRIYRSLPPFDLLRVPARLFPAALLFLSLAAGFGLQALSARAGGKLLAALLGLGLLFETWIVPYPTHAIRVPSAVQQIAEGPREGSVLTLPYVPGANESMLWQTQHGLDVPISYVARIHPSRLDMIRLSTPDLFAISLGLFQPDPAGLAVDLGHMGIRHILFRDLGAGGYDPDWLYSVLDGMDGWERSPDLGDGVEWWFRTGL